MSAWYPSRGDTKRSSICGSSATWADAIACGLSLATSPLEFRLGEGISELNVSGRKA